MPKFLFIYFVSKFFFASHRTFEWHHASLFAMFPLASHLGSHSLYRCLVDLTQAIIVVLLIFEFVTFLILFLQTVFIYDLSAWRRKKVSFTRSSGVSLYSMCLFFWLYFKAILDVGLMTAPRLLSAVCFTLPLKKYKLQPFQIRKKWKN